MTANEKCPEGLSSHNSPAVFNEGAERRSEQ
jgi:hypothetical protein